MSVSYRNVVFGVGSNLRGRLRNLREAVEKLARSGFNIEIKSNVFETEPWGFKDQPPFLNACVKAGIDKDLLSPVEILGIIKKIESDMGREESFRYAPRIIDIDLLLVDSIIYEDELLSVPHKEIYNRAFVLYPLLEVYPGWIHPISGESVNKAAVKYERPVRVVKL